MGKSRAAAQNALEKFLRPYGLVDELKDAKRKKYYPSGLGFRHIRRADRDKRKKAAKQH